MRGKACCFLRPYLPKRITPAYAGKRIPAAVPVDLYRDHPRLCGEKATPAAPLRHSTGSPPPMRGKANTIDYSAIALGITPAYAGKSRFACRGTSTK